MKTAAEIAAELRRDAEALRRVPQTFDVSYLDQVANHVEQLVGPGSREQTIFNAAASFLSAACHLHGDEYNLLDGELTQDNRSEHVRHAVGMAQQLWDLTYGWGQDDA